VPVLHSPHGQEKAKAAEENDSSKDGGAQEKAGHQAESYGEEENKADRREQKSRSGREKSGA